MQNLKPGALARLGFAPAALRAEFPRLIVCSISGYGDEGPMSQRKAYDLLIQAESGLCSITGGPDAPSRVGISIVDIATGATAHAAILEALIRRGITGEGADIRVSMFDVIADWLTVPLLQHEGGATPTRQGLAHPSIAPYGVFMTGDGRELLIAIQKDREWAQLCRGILEAPALLTDPRFATNTARVGNRPETDGLVASAFRRLSSEDAEARLVRADVAFARLNDMAALSPHPHLRRIVVETSKGPIALPAPGAQFLGEERQYGASPALGDWREAS